MNLRTKLLAGIGLALIVIFTTVAVFSYISMDGSYRTLERQEVERATGSTVNTLVSDMENTYSVTRDYSAWTETWLFAEGRNPGWIDQNTGDDFFERFDISYLLVFDRTGRLVLAKGYDLPSRQRVDVPAGLAGTVHDLNAERSIFAATDGTVGLLDRPEGPVMVTSHPILHDNFDGPAAGSMHFVRRIDSRYLADLAARAGNAVTLVPAREIDAPLPAGTITSSSGGFPVAVRTEGADTVAGYATIGGLRDADRFFVRVAEPRTLYQAGQEMIFLFLASLLGAGLVIILIVLLFIDRVVLSRLNTIIGTVRMKGGSGNDGDPGAGTPGDDELSRLALEIDPVFSRLTESRIKLKESEERYRTLAESARDIIFIVNREDVVTYVNSFAAESFGRPREEIIGMKRADLFPDPVNRHQRTNIVRVLVNGEPVKAESCLPPQNRWHDTLLVPIKDRTGQITGVMGVSRDITERKKAEEALRQSELRYQELFELGGEAIFLIENETGRILEANAAASEMYGYDHDGLMGMSYHGLLSRAEVEGMIAPGTQAESVVVPLQHHRKKDGTEFPVEIHGRFFESDGRKVHVAAIRDITVRRQAEATLRESNERFKTVMDSLDAFVYVADMKTHEILFLNQTGRNLWGDATGRPCWNYFQAGQTGPCANCTNDLLVDADGNPAGVHVWENRNAVNGRWYECRDRAIRWIDGRLVRLEIATDITDRKQAGEALVQANNKLNLLSSITRHDILNQLTALKAYISLSAERARDEMLAEFIRKEMTIADQIGRQIHFTRDYHKLGVKAPLWQNIADTIDWTKQSLLMRNIRIRTDFTDLEVSADPLLEKVFYNLIDNALRYGGEKMTTIRFSHRETDDCLVIICEDDGTGIAAENKELIFNRGFAHNTGLGLFLSREILGITGSSITETGVYGTGARFEIRVPKGMFRFTGTTGHPHRAIGPDHPSLTPSTTPDFTAGHHTTGLSDRP